MGLDSGRAATSGLCVGVSGVVTGGRLGFSGSDAGVHTTAGGSETDGNAGGTREAEGCDGSDEGGTVVEGTVVEGTVVEGTVVEGTVVEGTGDDFRGVG